MEEKSANIENLKQKAVKSVFWVYVSIITLKSLGMLTSLVLAKILFPQDFGLIALATIIVGFLQTTAMLGLNIAIIQKYKLNKDTISTCFFYTCCMGIGITLLTIGGAHFISEFYKSEQLKRVIQWLSLTILFSTMSAVPSSLLEKNFSFKKRSISEILPQVIYATVSISLAYYGMGVMSIVFGQIIARAAEMILIFFLQPLELVWKVNFKIFKEMFSYGKELLFLSYLTYFILNFDNLFVGKVLGAVQLGFYAVAYTIANAPATHITNVIQRVSFPFYAQVQSDKVLLQKGFLKALAFTFFFSIPLMFGIIFFGKFILYSLYQEKWLSIVVPLQVLSVMGFLRGLGANCNSFFCAIGKPEKARNTTLLMVMMMILFIYPLTQWLGITGTAVCILILATTSSSILLYWTMRELEIRMQQIMDIVKIFAGSTFFTMIVLFILKAFVFKNANVLNAAGFVSSAILVYCWSVYYLDKTCILQMRLIKTYFQAEGK